MSRKREAQSCKTGKIMSDKQRRSTAKRSFMHGCTLIEVEIKQGFEKNANAHRSVEKVGINQLKRDVNRLFLAEQQLTNGLLSWQLSLNNRVQSMSQNIEPFCMENTFSKTFWAWRSVERWASGGVSGGDVHTDAAATVVFPGSRER